MKPKRERDRNWTMHEKKLLQIAVHPFLDVIDSKCNNMEMIERKKEVWRRVAAKLRPHGVQFEIPKLKQQWLRMKDQARVRVRGGRNVKAREPKDTRLIEPDFNDESNGTSIKKERSPSETSVIDIDCIEPCIELRQTFKHPTPNWKNVSFEQQLFEKQLEKINTEIVHETVLFEIKKEIELNKLELIKLQIKRERESV